MWLIGEYTGCALFSLKLSLATASGGKALLVPTPFALKMGLLDVLFRAQGIARAQALWPRIRDLALAYAPPRYAVVSNTFTKVLKPSRNPKPLGSPGAGPLARSIGYRQYVQWQGVFGIALALPSQEERDLWPLLLAGLNYLGKRGGFIQIVRPPYTVEDLPTDYVQVNPSGGQDSFDQRGLLEMLDDCGPDMTFAQADIYSGQPIRLGKERVSLPIVLPYRLVRSSKSYMLYERLG